MSYLSRVMGFKVEPTTARLGSPILRGRKVVFSALRTHRAGSWGLFSVSAGQGKGKEGYVYLFFGFMCVGTEG